MQDLEKKIKLLVKEFSELKKSIDLDSKKNRVSELEAASTDPDLWKDQAKAKMVLQELADLKEELKEVEALEEELRILEQLAQEGQLSIDLGKEIEKLEERVEKIRIKSFLSGKYDARNAIVSIHAGQGGVEAMDWASMLYRMYLRFCERRGWKTQTIDISPGEEAGIKSVVFKVEGSYAYGYLKEEAGTHRLVRQSPFNADKLRQTSFALVEVLPELAEDSEIEIKDDDLEWQFFRASSQGGQNVQKVSTAVRLKHKPTGIVVTAQTERYQEQNRKNALNLLRGKLWALKQDETAKQRKEIKGEYTPASWGTQIRSYVLHPYKMVKDLRTQLETSDAEAVLAGDLDKFIEAELKLPKAKK